MSANDALVSLSFGAIQSQERPVGLWIAAAFVLGGLLGLTVGLRLFHLVKISPLAQLPKQY